MAALFKNGDLAVVGLTAQVFAKQHLVGQVIGLANNGLRIVEWAGEAHVDRPDPKVDRYLITVDNPTFTGPEFVIPWHAIQLIAVNPNVSSVANKRELSPDDAVSFHLWSQRFVTEG